MKIQNKGLVIALLLIIAALGAYGALSRAEPVAQHSASTPHNSINSTNGTQTDPLNTFTDGRKALPIQEEDRKWLNDALARGEIRIATEADKREWEAEAKKRNRPLKTFKEDHGRTFVILKPITIPFISPFITFILDRGTPFPDAEHSASAIYVISSGGWYQSANYDDGFTTGIGLYPHKY